MSLLLDTDEVETLLDFVNTIGSLTEALAPVFQRAMAAKLVSPLEQAEIEQCRAHLVALKPTIQRFAGLETEQSD